MQAPPDTYGGGNTSNGYQYPTPDPIQDNPYRNLVQHAFNPWDPQNMTDPRMFGVLNKSGGLGLYYLCNNVL